MHPRTERPARPARPARTRTRFVGLLAAGLSMAALVGCGSSGDASKPKPTEFCTAVEHYVEATKAGDRTDMADDLAASLDGLPEAGQRAVHAYVLALRGAPANHAPDEDGVTKDSTQESFDSYVAERCGKDAIPSGTTTTTSAASGSTSADAGDLGTGAGGSTGVQGSDTKTDPSSNSGSPSGPSGSTSGSSGSGSGSSMQSGGATG